MDPTRPQDDMLRALAARPPDPVMAPRSALSFTAEAQRTAQQQDGLLDRRYASPVASQRRWPGAAAQLKSPTLVAYCAHRAAENRRRARTLLPVFPAKSDLCAQAHDSCSSFSEHEEEIMRVLSGVIAQEQESK